MKASLTWRMRQGQSWLVASVTTPAESSARVATTLLREFAGKHLTPADVSVIGEVRRFHYRSDNMTLALRRLENT